MKAVDVATPMPARGVWHSIRRCNRCDQLFGTAGALKLHKPGRCNGDRTMTKGGAWRGQGGIWFTVDSEGFQAVTFRARKLLKTNGANLEKMAGKGNCPDPAQNVTRGRVCESCNRPFPATRKDVKFCSTACRQKAYRRRRWQS